MAVHRFRLVNVFTRGREPLTGNPLCVFEDATGLDTQTMQALALQFNLSETTFILPSTVADAKVRIFTPRYEMPFAGHPTLGTAHVLRALRPDLDSLRLELAAGCIAVRSERDHWTLTALESVSRELGASRAQIAAALSLREEDIGDRPLWVKAGKEQLIVPLTSTGAVRRAAPLPAAFEHLKSEDGASMAYVFAPDGSGRLLARFFFPQGPVMLEDPATGSATANLGGWWLALQHPLPVTLEIAQGEATGRASVLRLQVSAERRIDVGGEVVEIGSGSIQLG
jgi:PhzF family phenazine biosynthesis protein